MKKVLIYISLSLATILLITIIIASLNPMRQSEEKIREDLLKLVPIGTSYEMVDKIIEEHKEWEELDMAMYYGCESYRPENLPGPQGTIGIKTIIGEYTGEYAPMRRFDIESFLNTALFLGF